MNVREPDVLGNLLKESGFELNSKGGIDTDKEETGKVK